jgi:hypothetical protein
VSRSRRLAGAAHGALAAGTDRRSKLEMAALGQEGDSRAVAFVALKYYRPEHQCLSEWTADELRAFSAFCRKLAQMTWQQIVETGGRHKTGVGWTPVDRSQLPKTDFLHSISEDISWMELRVTQVARVFGFRAGHAFFLVFLDRTHDIIPV